VTGFLNISGSDQSLVTGSRTLGPWTIEGIADIGETLNLTLNTGDNNVAVPAEAVAAIIVPPAGSPALNVRTNLNPSDVGLPLAVVAADLTAVPFLYGLAAGVTELIIHAATGVGGCYVLFV
jgi:hypothetical protein